MWEFFAPIGMLFCGTALQTLCFTICSCSLSPAFCHAAMHLAGCHCLAILHDSQLTCVFESSINAYTNVYVLIPIAYIDIDICTFVIGCHPFIECFFCHRQCCCTLFIYKPSWLLDSPSTPSHNSISCTVINVVTILIFQSHSIIIIGQLIFYTFTITLPDELAANAS